MAPASPIPLFYRVLFNYVEPFFASMGAMSALTSPETLLTGSWLMFAFHGFVTLRFYRHNIGVWRHMLGAALFSDVFYTYSLIQGMGSALFFNPAKWDAFFAFSILSTVLPPVFKVLFLLGVGLSAERSGSNERQKNQ